MKDGLKRLQRLLALIEDSILILALISLLGLALIDIGMRIVTGGGVIWIPPVLQVLVLWLGLLGALYASRSQEHIAIDVLSRFASAKGKRFIGLVTNIFAMIICLLVAWSAVDFVSISREYEDIAFANVPAWPLQIIIPITFGLMSLRFFGHAIGYISFDGYQPNPALRAEGQS